MNVSVVIPAYNAKNFILDAVRSVLSQEARPSEIVVVNDGSTDFNYSNLQKIDETIKVIWQDNRGVSAARNLGCEASVGDYVAFLDADDVWLPWKLRIQMNYLERHQEVDAVFCRGLDWLPTIGASDWVEPPVPSPVEDPEVQRLRYADFLCGLPVAPSTMIIKKAAWKSLNGFKEDMRHGEDLDFYLRLAHRWNAELLAMVGMLYRRHPNSATGQLKRENHWAAVINRSVATLGTTDAWGGRSDPVRLARHLAYVHFQHGYEHFWADSFKIARGEFLQAIKKRPLHHRALVYFGLSSIPGLRRLVRRLRRRSVRSVH